MLIREDITKLRLKQRPGEWAEEAALSINTLNGGYQLGQEVTLSVGGQERPFVVEGMSKELLPEGWVQELQLVSSIARQGRLSAAKPQIFLTLTSREYEEFNREYGNQGDSLEFKPWVRLGNEFGEGGWDSNSIIQVLAGLLGTKVYIALPTYWVKQFTVKPTTSLLEAILDLVSPLRPLFYSVAGELFIVAEADTEVALMPENRFSLGGVKVVREEVRGGNASARAGRLRLVGNLGRFRPERYKGSLSTEPFRVVQDVAGSAAIINNCYGTSRETLFTQTGSIAFTDVPKLWGLGITDILIDPDTGVVSNFSLEEISVLRGKDIFGKATFLLSELRITHRYRLTDSGLRPIIYSIQKTAFQYENTHGSFASPREFGNVVGRDFYPRPGRVTSLDLAVFYPSMGQVVFGLYRNVEETHTYYWYNFRGELVAQNTITSGMVYTEDNIVFKPLSSLDREDISPYGSLRRGVIRQELVAYYQLSRDSYGVRKEIIRLNSQGKYTNNVDLQIVQAGAVQGSPAEPRKMQVYAERAQHGNALAAAPALEVQINTPSWESIEVIFPLLEENLSRNEVVRTYELFGELNMASGLQVDMQTFSSLDGREAISSPALHPGSVPVVVGYEIEKDALKGVTFTRLAVRGRLA